MLSRHCCNIIVFRLKHAHTLPKIFEVFAVGLGKLAAAATPNATFDENTFRAALRRKFYNREENKPKNKLSTGPHLPRDNFEFFKNEAKEVSANKKVAKKRPRRNSDSDFLVEESSDNEDKAAKKKKREKKKTSESSDEDKAGKKKKREKTKIVTSKETENVATELPLLNPPLVVLPPQDDLIEITHEESQKYNELSDIIFADPQLLADYNDDIKQVIFTQVHSLATHLSNGGNCENFTGWKCEHGVIPTNVQMKVEDETLKLPFPYISLFVPADVPAVQQLLETLPDPLPVVPPEAISEVASADQEEEGGKDDEAEEEEQDEEEDEEQGDGDKDAEVETPGDDDEETGVE